MDRVRVRFTAFCYLGAVVRGLCLGNYAKNFRQSIGILLY